jgi:multiple sugar transport system substrate-binding protein
MVESAGLDPNNPPKTWDQYVTWAKALTNKDHWATAILAGPTSTTTRVLLTWIYSNGGHPFSDDMKEATFAKDPKSLEAIKFYLSLASKYHVTAPAPASTNYNEQTVMFAHDKIADMRNAYWGVAKVLGDNPDLRDKLIVAAPPGNSPDAHTLATVTALSISANCPYPKQAWEFLKFITGPKWALMMVKAADWMPLRNDLLDNPEVKSDPVVQKFLEIGATAGTEPLPTPAWEQIASHDVVDAVQKALQEPSQTDQIFADLDKTVTKRLNEY